MVRKIKGRVTGTPSKDGIPVLRKFLKRDVQYLIIANVPSKEMEEVRRMLKRVRGNVRSRFLDMEFRSNEIRLALSVKVHRED